MKYVSAIMVVLANMLAFSSPALTAELVMLDQQGCAWCERWKKEIGPIYPKTDEAKIAPLRMVDINKPIPADLKNISIERFTPSFILVEDGKEISRMRGYAGDEFFWFLLDEMITKLPEKSTKHLN